MGTWGRSSAPTCGSCAGGGREKHRRAPKLGEDTEAVLRDYLRYPDERIVELKRSAVI